MQRAALYARVSTGLQEREQTIQSQLAAITRYAEEHGLRHTPASTYTDDGYSGTWLDRPALDELRDHAREGRFDVIVVLCPDRLARRYVYQVLLLEELKRLGIPVHFCERPIGDSPDDQLLLQIQGAIAEYERAKILERCRRGRVYRARRGELAPPVTPYGYVYGAKKFGGDGRIKIHPEEAAMVRQLFAWYAEEGVTLHQVLQRLKDSPWETRKGRQGWRGPTVLRMLRCEWYIGRAYYNRTRRHATEPARDSESAGSRRPKFVVTERPRSEWIVVPVPRLVDDATFARVQRRIQDNRRFARRRLRRRRAYLLRGLLKCGLCGRAYTGFAVRRANGEHTYYMCNLRSAHLVSGMTDRCTNEILRAEGVNEVVWATIRDLLLDCDALAPALRSWLARMTADPRSEDQRRLTTARLAELRRQRERLLDAYQAGALDLKDFQPRKTAIEDRIGAVQEEQTKLQSLAARQKLAKRQVVEAEDFVTKLRSRLHNPDFETRQAILRLILDRVVVTGHRLEIHLALPVSGGFGLTNNWLRRRDSNHRRSG
jgi:site-specific DNA recombinase